MIPRFGMGSAGVGGVRSLKHGWGAAQQGPIGFAVVGYTLLMLAIAIYMQFRGDVDPIGMLLLFGPRTYLVWPWIVLLLLAFMKSWRTGIVGIAGALVTLFGAAQFEVPFGWSAHTSHRAMRIVTYNADGSRELSYRIREDLEQWNADVVLFQGCATQLSDTLRALPNVAVHTSAEFCAVIRGTIDGVDTLSLAERHNRSGYGNLGNVMRYRVHIGGVAMPLYSVHLDSPRSALWEARHLDFSQLRANLNSRDLQSAYVSRFVQRTDSAFVVAGDFNTPYGSQFLRRDWSDLSNAFSEVGAGFGTTMRAGLFRVRIDHVLVPRSLVPTEATILSDFPSEHQPVIVDLAWR